MKEVNRDINERIKQIAHDLFKDNITAMAKATFISRSTIYSMYRGTELAAWLRCNS